jgi:hypothetical protein
LAAHRCALAAPWTATNLSTGLNTMTIAFPPATPAVILIDRLQATDWRKLYEQSRQVVITVAIATFAVLLVSGRLLRGGLKNSIRFFSWLAAVLQQLDTWLDNGEQQQQPAPAITNLEGQFLDEAMRMQTAELREYLGLKAKFSRAELIRRFIAARAKEAA